MLLGRITDADTTGELVDHTKLKFVFSEAARAIVLDSDNRVGVQYLSNLNFYKLPGGRIEFGETIEDCLIREIKEEVGCNITIEAELGNVIEVRAKIEPTHGGIYFSHGYLCRVVGEKGEVQLTEDEQKQGAEIVWLTFADAKKFISENNADYHGQFIWRRELLYLNAAEQYLTINI